MITCSHSVDKTPALEPIFLKIKILNEQWHTEDDGGGGDENATDNYSLNALIMMQLVQS